MDSAALAASLLLPLGVRSGVKFIAFTQLVFVELRRSLPSSFVSLDSLFAGFARVANGLAHSLPAFAGMARRAGRFPAKFYGGRTTVTPLIGEPVGDEIFLVQADVPHSLPRLVPSAHLRLARGVLHEDFIHIWLLV